MVQTSKTLSLLFLDFQKAYDRVSHSWLWHNLSTRGFPLHLLHLFQALYSSQVACLSINESLTPWFSMLGGVLQGDPVATLFFNLCIEPLLVTLESSSTATQGFVDDVAVGITNQHSTHDTVCHQPV